MEYSDYNKSLKYYKKIFEEDIFSEYDVKGFLIFLRKYKYIEKSILKDFANAVAHSEFESGKIVDSALKAFVNGVKINDGKVVDYHGFTEEDIVKEVEDIFEKINYNCNEKIVHEVVFCLYFIINDMSFKLTAPNFKKLINKYIGENILDKDDVTKIFNNLKNDSVDYQLYNKYPKYLDSFKKIENDYYLFKSLKCCIAYDKQREQLLILTMNYMDVHVDNGIIREKCDICHSLINFVKIKTKKDFDYIPSYEIIRKYGSLYVEDDEIKITCK